MNAVLSRRHTRFPRLSRLGWLMGLYAENHAKLVSLFDVRALAPGHYVSMAGDGLELHVEVMEQHRYTTELRLSYAMLDPVTGEPDPSAHVRVYHDAKQVEVTHCYVGRRWQDVIGLNPPPDAVFGYRFRINTFLGKWLDFLAPQGHGMPTLREWHRDATAVSKSA